MNNPGIRVNWPAAIVLGEKSVLQGRLSRLGEKQVVVDCDYQLAPGSQCRLALMLPGRNEAGKPSLVQGSCRVVESVLSEKGFRNGLKWVEIEAENEALLWRHARRDYVEQT